MLIMELTAAVDGLGDNGDLVIASRGGEPGAEDFIVAEEGGSYTVRRWEEGIIYNAVVLFVVK